MLGFGAIGRALAKLLHAFGVELYAVRKRASEAYFDAEHHTNVFPLVDLDSLLRKAELLIISLPHTSESEGLIDASRVALLPNNAIVVNVGRGPVIDQHALFEALKGNRIDSFANDVWWRYDYLSAFYIENKMNFRRFPRQF